MSVPAVPPPPGPPTGAPGSKFNFIRPGTVIFIVFMVVMGGGILIYKFTGPVSTSQANSQNNRTQTVKPGTTIEQGRLILAPTPTADATIKVFVTGEVETPGVYTMQTGERVEDAIIKAGGFTADADVNGLDLAQRVKDEMKIVVPVLSVVNETISQGGITLPPSSSSSEKNITPGAKSTRPAGKININTAGQPDLESLPGIGPVLASRILDYRAKNGPFKSLDDLRKVPGLNKSTVEKIKDLVVF